MASASRAERRSRSSASRRSSTARMTPVGVGETAVSRVVPVVGPVAGPVVAVIAVTCFGWWPPDGLSTRRWLDRPDRTHRVDRVCSAVATTLATTDEVTGNAPVLAGGYEPAITGVALAVAVGFEPTVVLPTHAFEACSFGRSDTPPPDRLPDARTPTTREELGQQGRALVLSNPTDHLRTVVESPIAQQFPHRTGGTCFRVPRAEHHARHPRQHQRTRAHRARFERHRKRAADELPRAERGPGPTQREDLRVPGRVGVRLPGITATADHRTGRI